MTSARIKCLTLAPGNGNIAQVGADVLAQASAIKAASTNVKNVKVAGSKAELEAGNFWPLAKSEQLSVDLKGGGLWFQLEETTDKLHVLSLLPS